MAHNGCASPARAAPCNRAFAGKQSAHANAPLLWSAAGAGRVHARVGPESTPNRSTCPRETAPNKAAAQAGNSFSKVQLLLTCQRTGFRAADYPRRAQLIWCAMLVRRPRPGVSLADQRAAASHLPANRLPRRRPPAPGNSASPCCSPATPAPWRNLVNQRAADSHLPANLLPRQRPPAPSATDPPCRTLATPTLWRVPR